MGDFVGRRALLFDSRSNRRRYLIYLHNGAADALDLSDHLLCFSLDRDNLRTDLIGCLRRLTCQRLDLACHDGKAFASFAGSRRFNGRIECQQIGLRSDLVDEADNFADFIGGSSKSGDRGVGSFTVGRSLAGHLRGLRDALSDVLDGGGKLVGRRRHCSDVR